MCYLGADYLQSTGPLLPTYLSPPGHIFYPGGGGMPKESHLKGEERKRRRKRRRGGIFTIHLYSLFSERFVVQNQNNLMVVLNTRHTVFAYSLYRFELLEKAL
jgi:hypothetical protein